MTPIGSPASDGSDAVYGHVNRRSYPFILLPVQKFQSFTTPSILLTVPLVRFVSGATVESNKFYEGAVEQCGNAGYIYPYGPKNTVDGSNYPQSFDCIITVTELDTTAISNTAYIGIEIGSQNLATPTNTPTTAAIHLKWMIKDPTQWMLSTYRGNGAAGIHTSFTVPSSTYPSGHKVRLYYDPQKSTVSAYVDDILRATQSLIGFDPTTMTSTTAGLILFSGVMTNPMSIIAGWMSGVVTHYDLQNTNAGVFA